VTLSRRKGKDAELELAAELRRIGFTDARRGVQYQGGPNSPDVCGVEGVHLEVKRVEQLSLYAALDQAVSEAPEGAVPVVVHRRSRRPWVMIVPLDCAVPFAIRWLRALGYEVRAPGREAGLGKPAGAEHLDLAGHLALRPKEAALCDSQEGA
jgi:Holliday junction resolvase